MLHIYRNSFIIQGGIHMREEEFSDYVVDGYYFRTKETALEAQNELNAIKYVSMKTDLKDPKQVYLLYNKLLEKELFKTIVGIGYLKKLQDFLYVSDEIPNDKIQPISVDYELQELLKGRREITRNKSVINKLKKEKKKYNDMFIKAIIVNVVLVAVIAFMIIITLTSKNPNIIDYENKLQNKYSTWQEELESQEESIKEREEELYKK